jgi:hypothetical protein
MDCGWNKKGVLMSCQQAVLSHCPYVAFHEGKMLGKYNEKTGVAMVALEKMGW